MPESWASTSSKARRTSSASPASHAIANTLRPSTSRTAAAFDRAARRVVAAMSSRERSASIGGCKILGSEAMASSHSRRRSLTPYARAFSITRPAAPASAPTSRSSSSVNSSAVDFSVRYRLPNTVPRIRTGTPRKDPIGGWCGGNPYDAGWSFRSFSRIGRGSLIRSPRMPRPCGRSPIRRRSSCSIPVVTKSIRRLSGPTTPSAPNRASVKAVAPSTMRLRTLWRSRSDERAMTASNRVLADPDG